MLQSVQSLSLIILALDSAELEDKPEFLLIDAQLEGFILSLPSLPPPPDLPSEILRHLSLTHMIARLAIIQLHIRFTDEVFMSVLKCLSACKANVNAFRGLIPDDTVSIQMDPIVLVSGTDLSMTYEMITWVLFFR